MLITGCSQCVRKCNVLTHYFNLSLILAAMILTSVTVTVDIFYVNIIREKVTAGSKDTMPGSAACLLVLHCLR